jgi:hypothetical protein
MVQYKVLSLHVPAGTEENHNKPQDSESLCLALNLEPVQFSVGQNYVSGCLWNIQQ